jgi:hypothetical protein
MNADKFNEVLDTCLESDRSTLGAKGDEYARGDRLSNFKEIAVMLKCTPEKALLSLVAKHWIAMCDFVRDIDTGKVQSMDRWREKTGDIRRYMILLEAMVEERCTNFKSNIDSIFEQVTSSNREVEDNLLDCSLPWIRADIDRIKKDLYVKTTCGCCHRPIEVLRSTYDESKTDDPRITKSIYCSECLLKAKVDAARESQRQMKMMLNEKPPVSKD